MSRPRLLDSSPGTFSRRIQRGRAIPMIRLRTYQSPVRSPASPRRAPATETSWHGNPAQMASGRTNSVAWRFRYFRSSRYRSFQMSLIRRTCGKCRSRTDRHCRSCSTCNVQFMPASSNPRSNPPTPEKRDQKFTLILPSISKPPEQRAAAHLRPRSIFRRSDCELGCHPETAFD